MAARRVVPRRERGRPGGARMLRGERLPGGEPVSLLALCSLPGAFGGRGRSAARGPARQLGGCRRGRRGRGARRQRQQEREARGKAPERGGEKGEGGERENFVSRRALRAGRGCCRGCFDGPSPGSLGSSLLLARPPGGGGLGGSSSNSSRRRAALLECLPSPLAAPQTSPRPPPPPDPALPRA